MTCTDNALRRAMPVSAWVLARGAVLLIAIVLGMPLGINPAMALESIVVDPRTDRVEITNRGEIWDNRGDSLQVETAAGLDGVVGRMDVKAVTPGTNPNWIVFALTNRTDRHIEHWLTADRYNPVGSGGVWPDLDASRIAAVTPSIGFVPERVASDRADVFRITLEPGQTITFVAELSSERFSRIFLWKPLAYELKVRERQLFNGTLLGLTGLMAIFLTAIFAANHKAIFPTAALVAWCVLVYLCVDFGFFHKLFNLRPEDNAVYRAAGEASIAASLVIFFYTFLRLRLGHGLVRMLFGVWMLAQLALIAVAVVDPRLSATFARLSFLLIGGAGAAIILFLAVRGQDRAQSIIPTWMLFLVWVFATAVTLTGRMSGDIVVAGLAAGLVLIVVLIGFTVTQFAFRSMEPAYGAAPDEQQLRALAVDGVGAATWEWSARRDEIKVSNVLEGQLGLNHGELSAKVEEFLQHVHSADRDRFRLVLWSIQERSGGRMRIEFRLRHSDNSYRWFELEAASVESADRRNVRCVGLLRDITDPKRTHERLVYDAVQCRVTDLPNKEIFLDRLSVASQRAKLEDDVRPTVIFIDLDRFRTVNANLGLQVADSLLLTIARRLKRHLDRNDTLARIGGDQFAMLLLNAQDPRELAALAERIRRSLRSPINIAGQDVVLTGSLGIAVYEGDGSTPEELLKGAEIAMYRAKRKGADRIEIYQPEMRSEAAGLPLEEQELRQAIEQGALKVYFQPIVYLPTEELAGFEAVLQWDHPRLKAVGHSSVVELAERSDIIRKVGGILLTQSLKAAKSWQTLLPRTEAPLFVSVNLSNCQMFKPEVIDEWRQIINSDTLPSNCLRLEVTEALAMENPERAVEMMRILSGSGAEIVLDEFGAGYSSVVYLQRFPVDTIKIDKAIVQDGTAGESEGGAVIRSVASLAHELGKKVLAEGVEIEEDVVFLRAIGCEYGQGLYYGEPMPGAEVADLVRLIAKSERKLEAPGLFRTRPKKAKKSKKVEKPGSANGQMPHAAAGEQRGSNGAHDMRNGRPQASGQGAALNGSPPPQNLSVQGNGAKSPRPTPDDVKKDARRAIAGLPNVTVRPIERMQPPRQDGDTRSGGKVRGVGADGAPPPLPQPPATANPFNGEEKSGASPNPTPVPTPPPIAQASPPSTGPSVPKADDREPTVRVSTAAPAPRRSPSFPSAQLPAVQPPPLGSDQKPPARPGSSATASASSQPKPTRPPQAPAPGRHGAPVPGQPQSTARPSSSSGPVQFPQAKPSSRPKNGPAGDGSGRVPRPTHSAKPGLPFPPEKSAGDSVPPTQPGPGRNGASRNGFGSAGGNNDSVQPVNGGLPPPNGPGKAPFDHLPPGIAASLERLAGKANKRTGGGGQGPGSRPTIKKRDSG